MMDISLVDKSNRYKVKYISHKPKTQEARNATFIKLLT